MWMSNTHHLIIIIFSIYNLMKPDCQDPYPLQTMYDDLCWVKVDKK